MSWKTLEEASKVGPSRATWERRVASQSVPSYRDERGRRMVWVSTSESPPSWGLNLLAQADGLQAAVETLTSQLAEARMDIASLRSELKSAKTSAPKPEVLSLRPASERPAQRLSGGRFPASRPKKARAAESRQAPTAEEESAVALLRRLVKAAGGQGALSRRSGIPQPSISKWLSGKRYPSEEFRATLAELAKELGVDDQGEAKAA